MKSYFLLALTSLLSITSTNAVAKNYFYAGLAAGASSFNYDNIDPGAAGKAYLGYTIMKNLSVEASVYDSGDADITNLPEAATINASGTNISLFYRIPRHRYHYTAQLGAGFYSFDTKFDSLNDTLDDSQTASGLSLSANIQYEFNGWFALRADIDSFVGLKDFYKDETMTTVYIGAAVKF